MSPALLAVAYFAAAEAGSALSLPGHFATFWPPSGVFLAALVLSDARRWPLLVLATMPANLSFDALHGRPLLLSLAYWGGNALEALTGAWLLRRFVGLPLTLRRQKEVAALTCLCAIASTTLSATVGAAATAITYGEGHYGSLWRTWWVGDALGVLLVAPVILTWSHAEPARRGERLAFAAAVSLLPLVLVVQAMGSSRLLVPLPMLVFPVLGWGAWRFGPRGAALALLLTGLAAIWNHAHGRGFFAEQGGAIGSSLVRMQAFFCVAAVTFLAIAASVAERRRIERALRESEARFRTMADTAPVLIWIADRQARCEFGNRVWCDLTGRPLDEAMGTGWQDFVHDEDRERVLEAYAAAARAGTTYACEFRLRHAGGGHRWLLSSATPRFDPDGRLVGYVGSAVDITERKEVEAAAAQAREAALEASQLKSEFLANVSHEIRTPMTAILGYAEQLADPAAAGDRERWLATIRHNGQHLLRILNDLLDLSKIEAGKLSVEHVACSPAALVAEVVDLMRMRAAEKELTLAVEHRGAVPAVLHSDPTRIRQILLNLVGNAIKFTQRGGVRLAVGIAGDATPPALRIEVVDTGIGIAPEIQARLFVPFNQADSSTARTYGGTGLGLAIARRLATLLGGTLGLRSQPGQGSTFILTLPIAVAADACVLAERDRPPPAPHPAAGDATPLAGRVLLVEDASDSQELLALYLRQAGLEVEAAGEGLTACALAINAAASGAPFDVILMDMQMPVLDGYRATVRLRAAGYSRPIVALTAHAMEGEREKCLRAGCDDFATKPIAREALVDLIRRHLPCGRPLAGAVHSA